MLSSLTYYISIKLHKRTSLWIFNNSGLLPRDMASNPKTPEFQFVFNVNIFVLIIERPLQPQKPLTINEFSSSQAVR